MIRHGRRRKKKPARTMEKPLVPQLGSAAAKKKPPPAKPSGDGAEPPRGLECRSCGCRHFEVVQTRPLTDGRIYRRRACRYCGRRLTTIEQPAAGDDDSGAPASTSPF